MAATSVSITPPASATGVPVWLETLMASGRMIPTTTTSPLLTRLAETSVDEKKKEERLGPPEGKEEERREPPGSFLSPSEEIGSEGGPDHGGVPHLVPLQSPLHVHSFLLKRLEMEAKLLKKDRSNPHIADTLSTLAGWEDDVAFLRMYLDRAPTKKAPTKAKADEADKAENLVRALARLCIKEEGKNAEKLLTHLDLELPIPTGLLDGERCQVCGSFHAKCCGRCRMVRYCSVKCQTADFVHHRLKCRGFVNAANAQRAKLTLAYADTVKKRESLIRETMNHVWLIHLRHTKLDDLAHYFRGRASDWPNKDAMRDEVVKELMSVSLARQWIQTHFAPCTLGLYCEDQTALSYLRDGGPMMCVICRMLPARFCRKCTFVTTCETQSCVAKLHLAEMCATRVKALERSFDDTSYNHYNHSA